MAANQEDSRLWALTNENLPSSVSNSVYGNVRGGRLGDLYTMATHGSRMVVPVDEGSYFLATNPTPGTGVAGIAAADGFDDTEALFHIRNGSTTKRIYLDFIRIQATAAGTNGTNFNLAMKLDTGTTRYSSGGSSLTAVNPNMDSGATSEATAKFGALVTTAASSDARLLGAFLVRSVIKVIGDTVTIVFGASEKATANMIVAGTAICNTVIHMPAVVLGETDQFLLHEWAGSQSVAASYQFSIGWYER